MGAGGIGELISGVARWGPGGMCRSAPAVRAHVIPQYICPGEIGRKWQKTHGGLGGVDVWEGSAIVVGGEMVIGGGAVMSVG